MKVRIAVSPGGSPADPAALAAVVDGLESRGFDTIWLSDVPMGPLVDPMLGLAFAAARTTRLKLGANVVPFGRSPFLLAKELAQLDQLSSGRLLLSLVPGLDQHGERDALTIGRRHRGRYIDELIPLLRQWWAGEAVDHHTEAFECTQLALPARPVQEPLEIWLGGVGPAAIERAGRFSDGWLGANLTPKEAGIAARRIGEIAADAGREIDPEHFGLSIPYLRGAPDDRLLDALRARRPDGDITDVAPQGADDLRRVLKLLIDEGLSKFVLRPVTAVADWDDELSWLAATVLDLQT
jgi:probable F420-dependent oxidoreductase